MGLTLALIPSGLLYLALRHAPIREIHMALARLQPWEIAVVICLNLFIYCLVAGRWWIVVHAENRQVRYLPMIGVRLSVFALSYLTVGPQVGGEPLQILHLRRTYGISYTRAMSSVIMDKLFELLGNFVLLCLGLAAIFHSGILGGGSTSSRVLLVLVGAVVSWPVLHILLLRFRIYPFSILLLALGPRVSQRKSARFLRAAERLAGKFCQRYPKRTLAGIAVSLAAAGASVSEYALITSFLHINLPFWRLVTAWTAGWLSFLAPVPGGLGTLETSQVSVLGYFGISAAAAVSVALVMRGRDLLLCGVGLLHAGSAARRAQIRNNEARRMIG